MVTSFANSLTYRTGVERDQDKASGKADTSIVDLLVWAYREQRVLEESLEHDEARYLAVGNGLGSLAKLLELGCAVDGGGRTQHKSHRDAQAIHKRLMRFAGMNADAAYAVALAIEFAKAGRTPEPPTDWAEVVQPLMKQGGRGIVMSYWDGDQRLEKRPDRKLRGNGGVCRVGQACEIVFAQEVELERHLAENYALWQLALLWLNNNLPVLIKWNVVKFQLDSNFRLSRKSALLMQLC